MASNNIWAATQRPKVYSVNSTEASPEGPDSCVVIHLKVDGKKEEDSFGNISAYDDTDVFVARPQELHMNNDWSSESLCYDPDDILKPEEPDDKSVVSEDARPSQYAQKAVNLLKEFSAKTKTGDWPFSTSTLCYWCCHGFGNTPIGIPRRFDGYHFYVTGCFCSFSCAAAYNLMSNENNSTIINRYTLLCTLANMLGCDEEVKAAPPREALKCFGGHMSIEEFRDNSETKALMVVNITPMKALAQQIEEVNDTDVGSGYNFIPIEQVRSERGLQSSELSLKRSKPLLNIKNTLHNTMNLQFHSKK